jgi:hypothetical protein
MPAAHRVDVELQSRGRTPTYLDRLLAQREALAELRPRDHDEIRLLRSDYPDGAAGVTGDRDLYGGFVQIVVGHE